MSKKSNKRKARRKICSVPVDGKKGTLFENIATIDISRSGLGFVTNKRIPLNKEIPIQLDLEQEQEPVLVIGKVRWVQAISHTKNYRVGVSFKKVEDKSKSRLVQYFKK